MAPHHNRKSDIWQRHSDTSAALWHRFRVVSIETEQFRDGKNQR
jgi:hypothetical protein